jgi:hypothetical protein
MYGKIFASMFTGSMMGAGSHVHAVMTYAVSNADERGYVELNPTLLAVLIGDPLERMEDAIAYLCRPDPHSRTPDENGRRLVREGQFLYHIVNYEKYRSARDKEARRQQNREAKRRQRQKSATSAQVSMRQQCQPRQPKSAQAEAEAEAEAYVLSSEERTKEHMGATSNTPGDNPCGPDSSQAAQPPAAAESKKASRKRSSFTPPAVEEVQAYAASKGYPDFDAQWFVDYYEAANWHDAKGNPVRNWKQKFLGVWAKRLPERTRDSEAQRDDADSDLTDEEAYELLRECGIETKPGPASEEDLEKLRRQNPGVKIGGKVYHGS